jgi:hypothetical protein
MPEGTMDTGRPRGGCQTFVAAALPAIRLRLLQPDGAAGGASLRVPAGGIGMGAALQVGGRVVSTGQRLAGDLCRITWREDCGGWQLHNAGHALACALNEERVVGDWPWPIEIGDVLEFGVLRFVVEADEATPCWIGCQRQCS